MQHYKQNNFQKQMETLIEMYEQRLKDLSQTFLHLLNQVQQCNLFNVPQLSKYRLEYLGDIIKKTLGQDREKIILKLYAKIDQLTKENNEIQDKYNILSNQSYHQRHDQQYKDRSLRSTKVSIDHEKYHEEDSTDFSNILNSTNRSKKYLQRIKQRQQYKKRQILIKNQQSKTQNFWNEQENILTSFKFKYLQL